MILANRYRYENKTQQKIFLHEYSISCHFNNFSLWFLCFQVSKSLQNKGT